VNDGSSGFGKPLAESGVPKSATSIRSPVPARSAASWTRMAQGYAQFIKPFSSAILCHSVSPFHFQHTGTGVA
jgi:hypothetical protein